MKSTETFYAVQISGLVTRRPSLAIGGTGPKLSYFRRAAIDFKRQMVANGFKTARVVKVQVTYSW